MTSIAAHLAAAAIDAAPYLQAFFTVGVVYTIRFWGLQRHHIGRPRRTGRGFSRVSFCLCTHGRRWLSRAVESTAAAGGGAPSRSRTRASALGPFCSAAPLIGQLAEPPLQQNQDRWQTADTIQHDCLYLYPSVELTVKSIVTFRFTHQTSRALQEDIHPTSLTWPKRSSFSVLAGLACHLPTNFSSTPFPKPKTA